MTSDHDLVSQASFPYIDIAANLIEDWKPRQPAPGTPEQRADAIMAAFSLTRLREHLVLHLTIDGIPDDELDEVITGFDLHERQPHRPAGRPEGPLSSHDIAAASAAPRAAAVG